MRSIVLGNQRLLVNLDSNLFVRDIFYKRVGQENHVLGIPHKIGVYVDNKLSWLDEKGWVKETRSDCSLCGTSTATNKKLGVTLQFVDLVLKDKDVLLRRITANKELKLFVYHYFFLYGDGIGDCAGFDPQHNTIFHYKRNRYFQIGCLEGNNSALSDYTVSAPENNKEAWRDAEDGVLSKNAIAQGHVDSCIAISLTADKPVDYVLVGGANFPKANKIYESLVSSDRNALVEQTLDEQHKYAKAPEGISEEWKRIYETSILVLRAHTDSGGAITAANDSDNMLFNKDTYSYVWGRDGALVAHALDNAGKYELTREFYNFMEKIIEPEGCYLHKYHPDGSLGSSWHAWVRDGKKYIPLQEDSTALMLYSLQNYHEQAKDDFLSDKYEWISQMTDFLVGYARDDIQLPKDCWDLWEERQGIHTWTVAATIAGLKAGAFFAKLRDDEKRYTACSALAERFTQSMLEYLYSKQYNRLIRRLSPDLQPDLTIDAADIAPFLFEILPAYHPAIKATAAAIEQNLMTPIGGIARYQGDYFYRKTEKAPGNAWIICTLWLAQWHLAMKNRKRAEELIDWVVKNATPTHLLPEQVHPETGEPLSVCPLTWSHATFIDTILKYVKDNK